MELYSNEITNKTSQLGDLLINPIINTIKLDKACLSGIILLYSMGFSFREIAALEVEWKQKSNHWTAKELNALKMKAGCPNEWTKSGWQPKHKRKESEMPIVKNILNIKGWDVWTVPVTATIKEALILMAEEYRCCCSDGR